MQPISLAASRYLSRVNLNQEDKRVDGNSVPSYSTRPAFPSLSKFSNFPSRNQDPGANFGDQENQYGIGFPVRSISMMHLPAVPVTNRPNFPSSFLTRDQHPEANYEGIKNPFPAFYPGNLNRATSLMHLPTKKTQNSQQMEPLKANHPEYPAASQYTAFSTNSQDPGMIHEDPVTRIDYQMPNQTAMKYRNRAFSMIQHTSSSHQMEPLKANHPEYPAASQYTAFSTNSQDPGTIHEDPVPRIDYQMPNQTAMKYRNRAFSMIHLPAEKSKNLPRNMRSSHQKEPLYTKTIFIPKAQSLLALHHSASPYEHPAKFSSNQMSSIPDFNSSEVNHNVNETYVIDKNPNPLENSSFDCKDNEDFGRKKNTGESFLTSDFSFKSKSMENLDSWLFSSPPGKRSKMSDLTEDSIINQSIQPNKLDKMFAKITTEALFGDKSISSGKISDEADNSNNATSSSGNEVIEISSSMCLEESADIVTEARPNKSNGSDTAQNRAEISISSDSFSKSLDEKEKTPPVIDQEIPVSIASQHEEPKLPNIPVSASEPIATRSKTFLASKAKSQPNPIEHVEIPLPEKLSTSVDEAAKSKKQKELEKVNAIFISVKNSRINYDRVNTYYNTRDRPCPLLKKKKPAEPCNVEGDAPDFEEVKKFMANRDSPEYEEHFELGRRDFNVFQEDSHEKTFDYGEIAFSLKEIEESFQNPRVLTSTPEKSFKKEEDSVLIDKKVEIIPDVTTASAGLTDLTHISSSVPPVSVDENYEFALNSILNITQRNLTAQEGRIDASDRFDYLLSLIREDDLVEESMMPDNAEKSIVENRRAVIMGQIEGIIQSVLSSLVDQKTTVLKIRKVKDFKDCTMTDNVLSQKETAISMKTISLTNRNTERSFVILIHLLCEIYKMLSKGMFCTKRELYYRDTSLMVNQATVNRAIQDICILLNVLPWEIGVLSTSKGLVAGNLKITMTDDEIIDCNQITRNVPQNPSEIKEVQSQADFILIVEKDTVFTRLVQDKFFENSRSKMILVTGKGYPDVNTRVLLNRLDADLKIPIYIIVDADPHGIEIMCTYKYGSLQMVQNSDVLAVKNVQWLGVYPTDIEPLDIAHTSLTAAELKKVNELLTRPYINPKLKQELCCLKDRKLKAEIEGLYEKSTEYFINDFISSKIMGLAEPLMDMLAGVSDQWNNGGKDKYVL